MLGYNQKTGLAAGTNRLVNFNLIGNVFHLYMIVCVEFVPSV